MWRPSGHIAEQVFNVKQVSNESDTYYVWNKGQRFRVLRSDGKGSLRADGTRAKVSNVGFTEASYKAQEYAKATYITDREKANADAALGLEQSRILAIQDELMLDMELRVAGIVTTTGNYTHGNIVTNSGTSQWNNASFASLNSNGTGHSAIYGQFLAAQQQIIKNTGGKRANKVVIPFEVAYVMANDPGLADMEKYTLNRLLQGMQITDGAKFMGMDVLMPTIQYQSTVEGEADNIGSVWGKNVILFYQDPNPGLNSLTFGLTFRKDAFGIRSWRDEGERKTFYECSLTQSENLVAQDCAYMIAAAIA